MALLRIAKFFIYDIAMNILIGLPPVLPASPGLLILGSMPSSASLSAQQYYAHPQNAFWRLILSLLGAQPSNNYAQRVAALKRGGIALWDVLAECRRQGSLDSAIVSDSERANDIAALLRRYSTIKAVAFNGGKARQSFMRHIRPTIAPEVMPSLLCLPSTSPANARLTWSQKWGAWSEILPFVRPVAPPLERQIIATKVEQ